MRMKIPEDEEQKVLEIREKIVICVLEIEGFV